MKNGLDDWPLLLAARVRRIAGGEERVPARHVAKVLPQPSTPEPSLNLP